MEITLYIALHTYPTYIGHTTPFFSSPLPTRSYLGEYHLYAYLHDRILLSAAAVFAFPHDANRGVNGTRTNFLRLSCCSGLGFQPCGLKEQLLHLHQAALAGRDGIAQRLRGGLVVGAEASGRVPEFGFQRGEERR